MHCSLHNRPLRPRFNEEITNEASGPNHSAGNDQWSIRASHALRIPFAYKVPVVFREHPEQSEGHPRPFVENAAVQILLQGDVSR